MLDESFDAATRELHVRLEIFFDGLKEAPLVVTEADYLVSFKLLEEATRDNSLFGAPSSNELCFQLVSADERFNPLNESSPYAGKIIKGLPVRAYIREGQHAESPLGEFYVSSWKTTLTKMQASVVANDKLYKVFEQKDEDFAFSPTSELSVKLFWEALLHKYELKPVVDPTLSAIIPLTFVTGSLPEAMQQLNAAYMSIVNCAHDGKVHVTNLRKSLDEPCKIHLTTDRHILDVDTSASLQSDVDSVLVEYSMPSITQEVKVLEKNSLDLTEPITELDLAYSKKPLYRLKQVHIYNAEHLVVANKIESTSNGIKLTLNSAAPHTRNVSLDIIGEVIELTKGRIGDENKKVLKVQSDYLQTRERANMLYEYLVRFADLSLPFLSLKTRGNPSYEIGDLVDVQYDCHDSSKIFHGIIMRQELSYNGSLDSKLLLVAVPREVSA